MADPVPLSDLRRSYARGRLEEADLAADWVTQFTRWFGEAVASARLTEPNAMVVATATPDGRPSRSRSRCTPATSGWTCRARSR